MVEQMGLGGDTVSWSVGEEHREARRHAELSWSRVRGKEFVALHRGALSERGASRMAASDGEVTRPARGVLCGHACSAPSHREAEHSSHHEQARARRWDGFEARVTLDV
jgi:hypothetical protein